MRMARVNVYLPDELAAEVKHAGLNVSGITQDALRTALASRRVGAWLDQIANLPPTRVTHEEAMAALDEARAELGGDGA